MTWTSNCGKRSGGLPEDGLSRRFGRPAGAKDGWPPFPRDERSSMRRDAQPGNGWASLCGIRACYCKRWKDSDSCKSKPKNTIAWLRGVLRISSCARAADVLGITVHQAKDALRSAVKRYQALTVTRKLEFDLINGDRAVGGEEMTLTELEALDSGPTAAGSVQERTAADGMMNGAGMSEDAAERALREAERYENGRSKRASGGEVESCIEGPLKALR